MEKTRVAIYGGTFDPVHSGHLEIIKFLSENYDLVIVVPTTVRYYKKNTCMFSFNQRYESIKEKVENPAPFGNVEVWDIERDVPDTWRYIDTLNKITKNFSGDMYEFTTVIGSDSLIDFEKWSEYNEILRKSKLLVIERPSYPIGRHNFVFGVVDSIKNTASSTELRNKLEKIMEDEEFEDYLIDIGWAFDE